MPITSLKTATFIIMALGAAVAACLDVTPITDVPAVDAGVAADVSVSPSVASSACFQCSAGVTEAGPSCGAEYAACSGDPKCLSLFLCGLPRGCYEAGSDLVQCLTACGIAAGVTGANDPAVAPFLALYGCATSSCSGACAKGANVALGPAPLPTPAPACEGPRGSTCPPTEGNCKGIGRPCTKGGGECADVHAMCDRDLDPRGVGFCVTILACSPGACGTGATCCKTATTQGVPICMPNQCLPSDCSADP